MKKIKGNKGFTLAETLMVLLIVSLVSIIVAGALPTAIKVYKGIMDYSNAQVLLSSAITKLRDELSTATEIEVLGEEISYKSSIGAKNRIYLTEDGVYIQEYLDISNDKLLNHSLISDKALDSKYRIMYDIKDYESGVFSFSSVSVYLKENKIAELKNIEIRIVSDIIE